MSVRHFLSAAMLAASVCLIPANGLRAAEPDEITAEARAAFDKRMFTVEPAQKGKIYACFTRRYDAAHLAVHPDQKVKTMKLLVSTEWLEDDTAPMYSFHLGMTFRNKRGDFDSSGGCNHVRVEESTDEVRLGCGVDCDGGGIGIALVRDDRSAMVRLDRVRIWPHGADLDEDGSVKGELVAGKDDGAFRLDRTGIDDCRSLVIDREEHAALLSKK